MAMLEVKTPKLPSPAELTKPLLRRNKRRKLHDDEPPTHGNVSITPSEAAAATRGVGCQPGTTAERLRSRTANPAHDLRAAVGKAGSSKQQRGREEAKAGGTATGEHQTASESEEAEANADADTDLGAGEGGPATARAPPPGGSKDISTLLAKATAKLKAMEERHVQGSVVAGREELLQGLSSAIQTSKVHHLKVSSFMTAAQRMVERVQDLHEKAMEGVSSVEEHLLEEMRGSSQAASLQAAKRSFQEALGELRRSTADY